MLDIPSRQVTHVDDYFLRTITSTLRLIRDLLEIS